MFTVKKEDIEKMSKEELFEQLKKSVSLRDKMGGAMYWNILNDECCELASRCAAAGVPREEIVPILGEGNFSY